MVKKYKIIILIFLLCLIVLLVVQKKQKKVSQSIESEWGNPEIALREAENAIINLDNIYKDSSIGFVFQYPKDFSVTNFTEGEEYVVLIQNATKNIGIQFSSFEFVDPFESLTKERIENDLGIILSDYSIIKIGKKQNIEAVTFLTGDTVKYREVWFMKGLSLVRVKAYKSSEPLIIAILKTLEI